ncbi:aspartate-rich protein 1-like isoform X4 [Macaca fascicularis]|uniref:aspartate-rich protein 1-like isoform X4 n=1 Tax=Macaca fascicularis TaxID=9541 RepID=UPI003D15648E
MECILTCCINSSCSWCRGKVAPCYESVIYEAVAAATSESTTVEPGKLDVGATEGHELQHISNQKMPTDFTITCPGFFYGQPEFSMPTTK